MTPWTEGLPYFPKHELECRGTRRIDDFGVPIPGTGVVRLDPRFAAQLPHLRVEWGSALIPNSVCRTPAHNASLNNGKGGHPRSLHLTQNPVHPTFGTMAIDIAWRHWRSERKLALARLGWKLGWAVGLHDGFGHFDRRKDIGLRKSVFIYGEWSAPFKLEDVFS